MSCCATNDKFPENFRNKLLKDLAANYAQVQKCYCAHKDRIQSVQEKLQYYRRMSHLQTALIIVTTLVLLALTFMMGLGTGFGLSNSQYGRRPCISTMPWQDDDCDVSF